jgi:hypothetical protein
MAKRQIDIALEDHSDVAIANGDFGAVESSAEHMYMLVANDKNDYKQNPTICVGPVNYIDDKSNRLLAAIGTELRRDGMTVSEVSASAGKITVKANY